MSFVDSVIAVFVSRGRDDEDTLNLRIGRARVAGSEDTSPSRYPWAETPFTPPQEGFALMDAQGPSATHADDVDMVRLLWASTPEIWDDSSPGALPDRFHPQYTEEDHDPYLDNPRTQGGPAHVCGAGCPEDCFRAV